MFTNQAAHAFEQVYGTQGNPISQTTSGNRGSFGSLGVQISQAALTPGLGTTLQDTVAEHHLMAGQHEAAQILQGLDGSRL